MGDLSLSLRLGHRRATPAPAPSFDYVITDATSWNNTIGTSSLGGATLSGKTIGIDPSGSYANLSVGQITGNALPVVIKSTNPAVKPLLDRITFAENLNKIDWSGCIFASSAWNTTGTGDSTGVISGNTQPAFAIMAGKTYTDCDWHDNEFRGNYRGDLNAYLTFDCQTNDVAEYACIPAAVVGGSYPVGAVSVTRDYVGGLLADGTGYAMAALKGGGSGFAGTFDVVAGRIVNAVITNGGTGYLNDATTTRTIGWIDRRPMGLVMPYAMQTLGTYSPANFPVMTNCKIRNNTFTMFANAMKPAAWYSGELEISGNFFDMNYQDCVSLGFNSSSIPSLTKINWNQFTRPFARAGDAQDPHSDAAQIFTDKVTNVTANMEAIGNEAWTGLARGSGGQIIFFADPPASGGVYVNGYKGHIVGNIGLTFQPNGMTEECAVSTYIYGDTTTGVPGDSRYTNAVTMGLSGGSGNPVAFGQSLIGKSIADLIATSAKASQNVTMSGNAQLGYNGSKIAHSSVFNDPTEPTSLAQLRTKWATIGAYTDLGAYRDPLWINHATRTYDRSREPTFVKFPPKSGQALSTRTESGGATVLGGVPGQAISITNGRYRIANSMTVAGVLNSPGAWTTTPGTIDPGQAVEVDVLNSGSPVTATTATLTINGYNFSFSSTTLSTTPFVLADNQDAAYSTLAATVSTDTGVTYVAMVWYGQIENIATNDNLAASQTQANFRWYYANTTSLRVTLGIASSINCRPAFTAAAMAQPQQHVLLVDLNEADVNAGMRYFIDGVEQGHSGSVWIPGNYPSGFTMNTQVLNGAIGLMANGAGGSIADGKVGLFGMHWGTNSYVRPVPDANFFAALSRELIGDGTPAFGQQMKLLYYDDSVANWNAGLSNRGSITKTLAKQAGTYV